MESPQKSGLVDPLSGLSLVSLFPRTFNQRDLDPDPNRRYNDPLEAVGAHLEYMALKNPNRLLEQAKSILDGGLESLSVDNLEKVRGGDTVGDLRGVHNANLQRDIENPKDARDEDTVGDLLEGNHDNLQGRRPALGRKRSRFSLKPNSSQSTESLNAYVDIDKLPDPEEFFLAFEKHENAKNELRRQSGKALLDLDQNVPHMAERRRRPGLLRKSASYKHRFSMAPSGEDNTFLSSQEALSQDLCSPTPSIHCLQTEHTGQESAGKEGPDDISDELQSGQDKADESDEIIGMLQKRFKPIEINKSCLPELNSVLQSEFRTLGESLQDSQDKVSDLHDIVTTIGKETTLGCNDLERRSGHSSTSPRPPKSPYSSISLLKARLFQSRQGKDPFAAFDADLSPIGKAGSCKDTHDLAARDLQKSVKDSVKMQNISSVHGLNIESDYTREANLNSPVYEIECNVVNGDTQDFAAAEFTSSENNTGDSMIIGIPSDSEEDMELDDDIVEHGERDVNPRLTLHNKESDTTHTMETAKDISKTSENLAPSEKTMTNSGTALNVTPDAESDHDIMAHNTIGGVSEDNPSEVSDDAAISDDEHMEPDDGVVEEDVEGLNMENSNCNKEQSTANAVEDHGKDRRSSDRDQPSSAGARDDLDHDRPSSSRARPLKKTRKASSKMAARREPAHVHPPAERRAPAARKQTRESIEFSRRKSLAACGTQWETGVRRSTRIRTRPLEYWNGERPLYGRIHDSLMTVVGTKFFCPGKKAGEGAFTVKSYVSDEYKEIVERAALH